MWTGTDVRGCAYRRVVRVTWMKGHRLWETRARRYDDGRRVHTAGPRGALGVRLHRRNGPSSFPHEDTSDRARAVT